MLQLKCQFLTPQKLDAAASEFLRRYAKWRGIVIAPPVDVDEIVEGYLKLDFEIKDLRSLLGVADVLGATWFDEKVIRVDQSLEGAEGRYAFTLAHEIGHWHLHRPLYEADNATLPLFGIPSGQREPSVVCRSSQGKTPAEYQADQFATRILMPESLVRAAFRDMVGAASVVVPELRELGQRVGRVQRLAAGLVQQGGFTNVSFEAMRIRLVELKLVHADPLLAGT